MKIREFFRLSKWKIILFLIISIPTIYALIGNYIPRCMVAPYCVPTIAEIILNFFTFLLYSPFYLLYNLIWDYPLKSLNLFFFGLLPVSIFIFFHFVFQLIYNYLILCLIILGYNKLRRKK